MSTRPPFPFPHPPWTILRARRLCSISWERLPPKVILLWTSTCCGPSWADGVWKAWLINMFKYRRQSFLFAKQLLNITDRPAMNQWNSYSLWLNTLKKWKIIRKPSTVRVTAESGKHLPVTVHQQSYQHIAGWKSPCLLHSLYIHSLAGIISF